MFALVLAGCGIPPVNTKFISSTPAAASSYAVAQRAVRACSKLPDKEATLRAFKRSGFRANQTETPRRNGGGTFTRFTIEAPDNAVSVLLSGGDCYVGLESMTPTQSYNLASIWVRAYGAKSNSALGDGLSDHVSGAWRKSFTEPARLPDRAAYEHRIYIAAYKTWPHGPYDPQRGVGYNIAGLFPDKPGAAVKLSYVRTCRPIVSTGPNSGAFLPCT